MRKLIASLSILMTPLLNGLMCWEINQLPGKSELPIPIPQEAFLWLTLGSVLGIAFFSTQSSGSQTSLETTNHAWVVGLPPVIGSVVLFGLLKSGHLPSELAQYAGYASLFLFVMGTLLPTLMAFLKMRQTSIAIPVSTTGLSPQEDRNRQALLNKVTNYWIKGVLEGSLSNRARIELGLEERLDAVQLNWQTPEQPRRSLPKGTKAIDQFDKMGKGCTLLILGDPGAGKTTTLLELTSELIKRAKTDSSLPIPLVFNLSSWAATEKQSIAEWLVKELDTRYQIPDKIGSAWVKNEQLLLLLDGLDEVSEERRNECVIAINEFKQSHGITEMVVCSRIKDYEALSDRLTFQGAIFIEDLTLEQINNYFDNAADKLQNVKTVWMNDAVLQELTKTPLILSVMAIAYNGMSVEDLPKMNLRERRKHLFNKYIEKMFERRKHNSKYCNKLTIQWLTWLAKVMLRESQTIFLIERMRPIWLSEKELNKYLFSFLLLTLILAFSMLIVFESFISRSSLVIVSLFSTILSLCVGAKSMKNSIFGRIIDAIIIFYNVDNNFVIESTTQPNQGIWMSFKNTLFLVFVVTLILGIFSVITEFSLYWSTIIGIFLGISSPGGLACIQHLVLRIILYRSGKIPWNYARFLDYATERIFLQKVGGGYIFIHRLLLDHFASLPLND